MKKAVVVGGSGFIGSHVADHLSEAGYQVTIYDKIESQWLRYDQKLVVGDVQDDKKLDQVISGADVVYNFAALADLNQALEQPLKTININILGNVNVMESCRTHKVKRFIYASTVYVYSREGGFYRCSKQACEVYIEEYQRQFGLDYTILRFGSLYGCRTDEQNAIYRFITEARLIQDEYLQNKSTIHAHRVLIKINDLQHHAQEYVISVNQTEISELIEAAKMIVKSSTDYLEISKKLTESISNRGIGNKSGLSGDLSKTLNILIGHLSKSRFLTIKLLYFEYQNNFLKDNAKVSEKKVPVEDHWRQQRSAFLRFLN